ncbi:geranylgeranylglycerol-phosphate geranylgeranyltransferase [Candidatus Micrarchaeota archaeon]|nr:geranylgeranylglycerol-phosphate geranylgeranyltransferase [Candidatus Micrarchaeota archaeon]
MAKKKNKIRNGRKRDLAPNKSKGTSSKIGSLNDWLKLARIEHSALVAIAIVISQALSAKFSGGSFAITYANLFPALGPFFITAGAFILNDYFGFETDRLNGRKERPIVGGRIGKEIALKASLFLMCLGLLLSLFVNFNCFAIALVFAFLSAIYDKVLKPLPLVGNVFIASSMAISFIYGNFAVALVIQPIILLFVGISFFAGVGRELIITLRDVEGDRKIGAKTLPMALGPKNTILLAAVLFGIAIMLSWQPMQQQYVSPYAFLIYANNLLLIKSLLLLADKQNEKNFKKTRNYTLVAILLGLLAFATLIFN